MNWIPVEEALPIPGERVLAYDVALKQAIALYYMRHGNNIRFEQWLYGHCYVMENVTHWMHLPQPPEK